MRGATWWLRLLVLETGNAWRMRPAQRTLAGLLWFASAIVMPVALVLVGDGRADAALDWLRSIDMPLALVLSAQSGSAVIALASRPDTESWVAPMETRGVARHMLYLTRLTRAVRWPAGLALAAMLLSLDSQRSGHVSELLLIAFFSLVGGGSLAWMVSSASRETARAVPVPASRGSGLSVLSGVALTEARRRLNLRRLALLAVPVLLVVPMSSPAQQVLRAVAAWLPMVFMITWIRQAALAGAAMRRWMPHMPFSRWRMRWLIWRYVGIGTLLCVVAIWFGWRATAAKAGALQP